MFMVIEFFIKLNIGNVNIVDFLLLSYDLEFDGGSGFW